MPETPVQPHKSKLTVEHAYTPAKRKWRRRLTGSLRSWSRVTFSRESYLSSLRSLLWVVPLTMLIWIYAEREQVVTLSNVTISVEPPPGQPGRLLVRFAPGTVHSIHAELYGPQALAEQVKDLLEANSISLEPERDLAAGERTIDVARALNRDPRVASKGVEVRNCVPAEVIVTVENIAPSTVEVRARPQDVKGLPPPVFSQPKVQVTLPEGDMKKAQAEGRLYVYPNLKDYTEVLAQPGLHHLVNVALIPAFDNPSNTATISPPAINIDVERRTDEVSWTLPLPVFASYPANANSDLYKAVYKTPYDTVTVVGPDEKIKPLRDGVQEGTYGVHADFDVDVLNNPEDPRNRTASLLYALPPGIRVIEQDTKKTIEYKLVPRSRANQ